MTGNFVVWRVLGFGGRPNPVVFSRGASFAARCAQGLLEPADPSKRDSVARLVAYGRLQLCVDDPVLVVVGSESQRQAAFDIVILMWLLAATTSFTMDLLCLDCAAHWQ